MTWSRSRFIMFGTVQLRAVRAAWYELFVHSERIRAATQGVHMLNLCNILCCSIPVEIYCYVSYAVRKQLVIMCSYRHNHFGTNPMQVIKIWSVAEPSQMKCCGAIPNEISRIYWTISEELIICQYPSWICLQWRRCEVLHSVWSVCSTPWGMRWTRQNWVVVTNPAIK